MTLHLDPEGRGATVFQCATATMMRVTRPQSPGQFRRGFERDQWYFAPVGDLGMTPRSNPYPTLDAAIRAVNAPTAD